MKAVGPRLSGVKEAGDPEQYVKAIMQAARVTMAALSLLLRSTRASRRS